MKLIGVIEGDGIGHEVVPAALEVVLGRTGIDLAFTHFDVSAERFCRTGVAIPDEDMTDPGRPPPIGNEASWARLGNFVARHCDPAPLHGQRDLGVRLPFAPPEGSESY